MTILSWQITGFALGADVETLVLTGKAAINGAGNALANSLIGNAADNQLNGAAGADSMAGGGGNDFYLVDSQNDLVSEDAYPLGHLGDSDTKPDEIIELTRSFLAGGLIELYDDAAASEQPSTARRTDKTVCAPSASQRAAAAAVRAPRAAMAAEC